MITIKGMVYIRYNRMETKNEKPEYFLQTTKGDYQLFYRQENFYIPDSYLGFFCWKMVEVSADKIDETQKIIELKNIVILIGEKIRNGETS